LLDFFREGLSGYGVYSKPSSQLISGPLVAV